MYIHVKVQVNTTETSLTQLDAQHLVVTVREPAKRNLANMRVIELLKAHFPQATRIQLVSGHHAPSKLFSLQFPDEQ